jgi:hypothetical protein
MAGARTRAAGAGRARGRAGRGRPEPGRGRPGRGRPGPRPGVPCSRRDVRGPAGEGREILGGRGRGWAALGPKRGGARLGRARGGGAAGTKWEERGKREEKGFPFSKIYFSLDECIHIFKQSKRMHGSAWCIKQNKVF